MQRTSAQLPPSQRCRSVARIPAAMEISRGCCGTNPGGDGDKQGLLFLYQVGEIQRDIPDELRFYRQNNNLGVFRYGMVIGVGIDLKPGA